LFGTMEAIVERVSLERDEQQYHSYDATMELERRLSILDSKMTHSVHVRLQDEKREKLDALHDHLVNDIKTDLKLEAAKADKREGSMVRRFEGLAGTMARRFHEERAARTAAVQVAMQQVQTQLDDLDPKKADDVMISLKQLRIQLEGERAERQAQDQRIQERIVQTTTAMKRALLEAAGDPN
jgi:RNAse (barnase) inhibitor barstar